ncbi:MAG: hypothetical protein U0531_17890 [Dehalococcoidia bacterium]
MEPALDAAEQVDQGILFDLRQAGHFAAQSSAWMAGRAVQQRQGIVRDAHEDDSTAGRGAAAPARAVPGCPRES